jgi:hypothetical protein
VPASISKMALHPTSSAASDSGARKRAFADADFIDI